MKRNYKKLNEKNIFFFLKNKIMIELRDFSNKIKISIFNLWFITPIQNKQSKKYYSFSY